MLRLAFVIALASLAVACGDDDRVPAPAPPSATVQALRTEDGLRLDARLFRADPDRLVILLHMFPAGQESWYPTAEWLQREGFSVLTLDFRGYGASDGKWTPEDIAYDVRAALRYAGEQGYERVALSGASMGATAAIVTAAGLTVDEVDAVVSLSAPSRFGQLNAEVAAGELRVPLFTVAARDDTSAAHAMGEIRARAALSADDVFEVPGDDHGTELLAGAAGDAVRARMLAFLKRTLGP